MSFNIKNFSLSKLIENFPLNKKNSKERYAKDSDKNKAIPIALVIVYTLLLFCLLAFWVWAIYALIKYWKQLPTWAKVIGILGLIPVLPIGPIITLVVVYAAKK
jgi:hypothetical protein